MNTAALPQGNRHDTTRHRPRPRDLHTGDGAPIAIPEGPIEVTTSADSTTLSWSVEEDIVGSAALPPDQFNQYVKDGKIRFKK